PEKWEPVFGKRSCSNKELERDDDSRKNHPALVTSRGLHARFDSGRLGCVASLSTHAIGIAGRGGLISGRGRGHGGSRRLTCKRNAFRSRGPDRREDVLPPALGGSALQLRR